MAWAKTGAWGTPQTDADDTVAAVPAPPKPATLADEEAFPSLGDAVKSQQDSKKDAKQQAKKKKAKPVVLSLQEFAAKVQQDELLDLPTAPNRDRTDAEPGALGGAFKQYGGGRQRYGDGEERRERRVEDDGPSRADESDNWGSDRRFVTGGQGGSGGGFGGHNRGGSGGYGDRPPRDFGPSRADEADSWASRGPPAGGYNDRHSERRGGFDDRPRRQYDLGTSRADEGDTWGRRELPPAAGRVSGRSTPDQGGRWGSGSGAPEGDRWGSSGDRAGPPSHDNGPAERPRLNLKPRTLPVEEPRPAAVESSSDQANGAAEQALNGFEGPAAGQPPKPRSNPFGAARPREEVLKEKGLPVVDPVLEGGSSSGRQGHDAKALAQRLAELQQQAKDADGETDVKVVVAELGSSELPISEAIAQLEQQIAALSTKAPSPTPQAAGSRARW